MQVGPFLLIQIQGISTCNLNCDYCYIPEETRKEKTHLTVNNAEIIFESILSSKYIADQGIIILWHDGEPLLQTISFYEEIFSIIQSLQIKYSKINIPIYHEFQTNGTLITEEWCKFFSKYDVDVSVSLDGPDFIHDVHRRSWSNQGSHARIMQGIRLLQEHKIGFSTVSVITQETLKYPDEFFHFFLENSIQHIGTNIEEKLAFHTTSSLFGEQTLHRFRAFIKRLWELTKQYPGKVFIREFIDVAGSIAFPSCYEDISRDINCYVTVPYKTFCIDTAGNFTTFSPDLMHTQSSHYGDFILGNLHKDSFDSVLETEKFRRIYQDILAGTQLCKEQCEYFGVCGGRWLANKYSEHGTFLSTETLACRLELKEIYNIILEDIEKELLMEPQPA